MALEPRGTIRAFLALDLDPTSLRRVARVADRLRMGSGAPSATWVPPARMHVTLKFMAGLPIDTVGPLAESLRSLIEGESAPVACSLRLDAFPTLEQARIVVVGLDDPGGSLARLAEKVDEVAHRHGVSREERPLRPHVTVARLKRPYDSRRWLRPELAQGAGDCRPASLTLFRSELGSAGSVYVPLLCLAFAQKTSTQTS
jgi:RNA 2',3'-cyclic 3'-phosphodiesterase